MSDYDAAFASAMGGGASADPYDAIMQSVMPAATKAPTKLAPLTGKDEPTGVFDAAMIASGRTFDRLGAGLQQAYYGARGNDAELTKLQAGQAEKSRLYAPLQKERPWATSIGEALPMLAVPVGGAGAGALGMMGRAALGGAIPEALSYGSVEDRAKSAALSGLGGAIGGGLGYGAGKLAQGFGRAPLGAVDEQALKAAKLLQERGIPVRPDQATGSRFLQNANAALDNLPFTSGAQQRFRAGQQEAFNNEAGRFIGQSGSVMDDSARAAAKEAIGKGYSEVAERNQIPAQTLWPMLSAIDDLAKESASPRLAGLANGIKDKIDLSTGALPGKAYKELDSKLGKALAGGGVEANYIGQMRDALRGAMRSSVRPEDAGKWAKLDAEYSALGAISKSVDESGNVSARKLYTATRDKGIAKLGRGELGDLAAAARKVLPDQIPNSGTAQRLAMQGLLSGGGFGAGYLASGGDWEKAGMGAAGALALPMLARSLINSPAALRAAQMGVNLPNFVKPIGGLLGASAGYAGPGLLYPATAP